MLVSQIARFDAVNTMNSATFSAMQNSNSLMSFMNNSNTFNSDNNMGFIHELDKKFAQELANSSLLYKLASLQVQLADKIQKSSKLDFLA